MGTSGVLTAALDRASDRPVYKQIADHLRAAIDSGRLGEGDQLPSEAQLMEHYGVARMTVRNAINLLQEEGRVTSEHGRGVYVRRLPPIRRLDSDRFARRHRKDGKAAFIAEAEHTGGTPIVDSLKVSRAVVPPSEIANRLKLGANDRVTVRSRRYLMDGRPMETAVSYIPADLADGTPINDPNPGPGGIYARIEEQGHVLGRFTEEVSARQPTPDESAALSLPPGVPVIHLVRTAYDMDDRAVEVCDTVMAADVYILSYDLPAH
jgi:GntR family transcriptional regulator